MEKRMNFSNLFLYSADYFRNESMSKPYKSMEEAFSSIEKALETLKKSELIFHYLISDAPTKEEKDIFITLKNDNIKHTAFLREIYAFYKKQKFPPKEFSYFINSKSYPDGVKKTRLINLEKIDMLRVIRAGIPDGYYKDMVFEILTDIFIDTCKFDHILYLNLENSLTSHENTRQTKEFTPDELASFDGSMGKPAYAAVNGIVYDLSYQAAWGGASHFGLMAGMDLTDQFEKCHNAPEILNKLPKVGILKK